MQSALFILDYSARSWSGVDDLYLALCKKVLESSLKPVLVYAGAPPDSTRQRFEQAGAAIYVLPYAPTARYYKSLRSIVKENNVVIADICFFDYFSLVPWFARLAGIKKIIYTEANSGDLTAAGWRLILLRLRTKLTCLPITITVAMSEFIKGRLVKVGMNSEKVLVIHQGIDTQKFSPDAEQKKKFAEQQRLDHGAVFLACVNRLVPFKRTDVILQALGILHKRGIAVHLYIAGDGPLRGELEQLSRNLGIAPLVSWLGHYPQPALLLKSCDVFVIASVGEAFGYVTVEAMSCGLPVVGSRSGATPELVKHAETGLLVDPLSPEAAADGIETLVRNPRLREDMSRNARKHAESRFGLDRVAKETGDLYARILAN